MYLPAPMTRPTLSRRAFLQACGAGGAALALPTLLVSATVIIHAGLFLVPRLLGIQLPETFHVGWLLRASAVTRAAPMLQPDGSMVTSVSEVVVDESLRIPIQDWITRKPFGALH